MKTFTKHVMSSLGGGGQASVATLSGGSVALPDFSKWGAVERKPMSGIRRKTAEHLSHAWNAIPHVTQFDKADITQLEQVRKKYRAEVEKAGGNLTVTADRRQGDRQRAQGLPAVQRLGGRGRRGHRLQEVHPRRHRRRHRERPARAGHPQRRPEEPHRDLGRDPGAGREGQGPQAHARRDVGRLDVDLEPRRHRRHRLHADRQLARGGDPRHLARRVRAGVERHRLRAAADAAAVAQLRPPADRRRRRHSLPALGRRRARAAPCADAAG